MAAKVKVFGAFISGGLFEDVWDVWDVEEMGLETRWDRMGLEVDGIRWAGDWRGGSVASPWNIKVMSRV